MTILRTLSGVLVASSLVFAQTPAQEPKPASSADSAALLSAARTALGGDAALDAIRSLVVEGMSESKLWSASFKISWVRPDKFVIQTQQMVGQTNVAQMYTFADGFNGEQVIHQEHRSIINPVNGGIVIGKRPKPPTPGTNEAAGDDALDAMRQRFLAFAIPLFVRTFDMVPADFVATGNRVYVSGGDADQLDAKLVDGTMSLFLDVATHRPVRLTHAPQSLTIPSPFNVVKPPAEDTRKERPDLLTAPDDAVLDFSDYKCNKGICWPRQFKLSVGGQVVEKVKLTDISLNPKINPDVFKTAK